MLETPETLEAYGILVRFTEDGTAASVIVSSSDGLKTFRAQRTVLEQLSRQLQRALKPPTPGVASRSAS